jgi:hypothetical protein
MLLLSLRGARRHLALSSRTRVEILQIDAFDLLHDAMLGHIFEELGLGLHVGLGLC